MRTELRVDSDKNEVKDEEKTVKNKAKKAKGRENRKKHRRRTGGTKSNTFK